MFFIHWLSRTARRSQTPRQPNRDRTKERRLKLLRLEQRRVLNADFTFLANGLNLENIDGDLTIREVSGSTGHQIEFDLAGGSLWQDHGSTGLFAIDNSTPGHSILSVAKSDLESLSSGVSLNAASSNFDLHFDTQSAALDLGQMHGTLAAEGFGEILQTTANDHAVRLGDVSLSADQITLSQFHGDDITLNANEIDLTGGAASFSGSTLSVHSGTTSHLVLGGTSDIVHELNFTDSDLSALDASFHRISFESLSAEADSSIHVDLTGADFRQAIMPGPETSLHLAADTVQIDGALSISGGLIEVTGTHAVTISANGSLTSHGGDVHVDAGEFGTLLDSGRVDVSNSEAGGIGGTVHLLGEQVGLFGSAEVDAFGHGGGGEVLIGGDLHGDNSAIHHAAQTYIGHDVEIHADALHHGDGGQVVVWSDEVTQAYGTLTARGGTVIGDGGLIETSSHNQLIVTRGGDASAPHGDAGIWLLDPLNVRIVAAPSMVYLVTEFAPLPFFAPTVVDSEVTAEAIVEQLRTGTTVVISTFNSGETEAGDVFQDALIDVTFDNLGGTATLVISAANDIIINGGFNATDGSLNILLEANAGADDLDNTLGDVQINAAVSLNGGSFSSTGVGFDSAGNPAATIIAAGGVSITHTGMVQVGQISTGADTGGSTFIRDADILGTINVGEGDVLIDGGNPDLVVMADITATGTIFLLADRDVIVEATVRAGVNPASPMDPLDPAADLSITSDADSNADGGFWLRESGNAADARLDAGGNITIVAAKLFDPAGNPGNGKISLRIDADEVTTPQQQIVAGQDLTIVANFGRVPDAGDIVIDGMMTATDGTLTVFFTDTAFLGADQTAGTDLLFQNAVRLTSNVTISAGNDATFASTVNDDGNSTTGSALTVTGPALVSPPGNMPAGGDILFVGKVGGMTNPNGVLDSLTVNGDGQIDFLSSVTVAGDINVTATSETGRTTFQDAVTTNTGSVTITNAGLLVTSSSAQFNVATNFTQNGTGSTELGAGITTTNGNVSFATGVLLTRAQQTAVPPGFDPLTTIDTTEGNGSITFGGTIDSEVAGQNEEQTITLANLTGATFTISWDPPNPPGRMNGAIEIVETTAAIPAGATAAMVKAALVELPSLTDADIDVSGDPGGPFTLTFQGAFRGTDVNPVTVAGTGLTASAVLTTMEGKEIDAEHNPLRLVAGAGAIVFRGNIGAEFVDVGLGVDGDQTLGDLSIESAQTVTFMDVVAVAANGSIQFGTATPIGGIAITGSSPIEFTSGQNILINGATTSNVDLTIRADGNLTLTEIADITADNNITLIADADGDANGNFVMTMADTESTDIDAGTGYIDVRGAQVSLGRLITTNGNLTSDEHPAIRVIATFDAILDINGDSDDSGQNSGLNLVVNQRDPQDPDSPGAGVVLEAVRGIGSLDNPLETDLASLFANNHDQSEQQQITLNNATGGNFTISWDPPGDAGPGTTFPIAFNATADVVKQEFLRAFSTLTPADLDVAGNPGGPFTLTFTGALAKTNVPEIITASVTAGTLLEEQTITLANTTSGNFTIAWDPPGAAGLKTTAPIPFDANADQVKAAFVAAVNDPPSFQFSPLDLDVSANTPGQFVLTFRGRFSNTDVPDVTVNATELNGTASVASVQRDASLIGIGPTVASSTVRDFTSSENNIAIHDIGTGADHRVDLIFVHNAANQVATPQFASKTVSFASADVDKNNRDPNPIASKITEITFSAATPGTDLNDVVINFTKSQHTNFTTTPPSGNTIGVPVITVTGHTINIDLDIGEDLNANGILDPGEDVNNNGNLDGTTANALRDAINSNHAANQLIRAQITKTDENSDPRIPGTDDVTLTLDSNPILSAPSLASVTLNPAGVETGVININVESGNLRVVADTSRLVLSEMQRGIDTLNPPDLAVAAIQSVNTIKLTADTIEVFDDILAIAAKTQVTTPTYTQSVVFIDNTTTTLSVVDASRFPAVGPTPLFIQLDSEILRVTSIDTANNLLTVERGQKDSSQNDTLAVAHHPGPIIVPFDGSATKLIVVDPRALTPFTGSPLNSDFFIRIDAETLRVTNIDFDNNELTVERGANTTVAASHVPGMVIADITAIQPSTQLGTHAINAMVTTLNVVDSGVFVDPDNNPATPFLIQIESEVFAVTNISGNQLTVQRGQSGTAAAPHAAGVLVTQVGVDPEIRQYIEINARANFELGADRVISTDDHYLNSLNLKEDLNGNGKLDPAEPFIDTNSNGKYDEGEPFTDTNSNGTYDVAEDFNRDGLLQFNTGEDLNRNGVLDFNEDANGNGVLDLRGDKPATTLNDDFFSQINHDVIHITADSNRTGSNGEVLLGENSTISTDNGIEQLISPSPNFTGINNGVFTFDPATAFFSGNVEVSNLTSRFLFNSDEIQPDGTTLPRNSVVFLGTLTFTIGSPGEKNLILDIDWGDHDRTLISEIPPIVANTMPARFDAVRNVYVFDPVKDQHATRYLIPEGGASYSIPHEFSQNAFNLKAADGKTAINEPGRAIGVTSDPVQVRFAVSQHSSIVIDGQAVLNPRAPSDPAAVPQNGLPDSKTGNGSQKGVNFPYAEDNPTLTQADPLFQLSSTNVLDQPDVFLPRFDNGVAGFVIPTPPSVPIPPTNVPIPPPALPSPFIPEVLAIATPQITTESSRSSATSSSISTDEYFELRRTNEDGTVTVERLNELAGESLLNRERFEEFVRELGDGEYEIFFITRDNKDGTTIPRSVIQFRLESGRLAPPANDSPNLFKPFKLVPLQSAPKPVPPVPPNNPNGNGATPNKNPNAPDGGIQKSSDDEMSALPFDERHSDASFALSGTALAAVDATVAAAESGSSETSPIAAGLLLLASTRWRKNRFNPFGTSQFSKTARLARKRIASADDQ
jgi:hypothetical protein